MVWSSADRNAERSRGEYDFGPPVTSPDERRSVIRLRTASVMPIDCSVNGLPFGAITSAPALTQRLASGMSEVMTISPLRGAFRDPVVGGIHAGTGGDALDQRILRHADEIARDHADRQAMPDRDAIDLVLHRAGVGIDIDAGGVQIRHFRSVDRIGFGQVFSSARGTPPGGKMRGKQLLEHACHGTFFAYDNGPERTRNQRKRA